MAYKKTFKKKQPVRKNKKVYSRPKPKRQIKNQRNRVNPLGFKVQFYHMTDMEQMEYMYQTNGITVNSKYTTERWEHFLLTRETPVDL